MILPFFVLLVTLSSKIQSELIKDPTIIPSKDFSAKKDAETIATGDSNTIANIIFHRTYDERKKIEDYYNKNLNPATHKTLMDALKASSVCSLNDLYGMVLEPAEEILANSLRGNIYQNCRPEVGAIEEVICANDKEMKDRINNQYQTKFGTTVENELAAFRTNDKAYQHVIQNYCWKGICQDKKIAAEDVDKEAQTLRDINPEKNKTDFKNKLIELLDKYCEPDLKQIFQKYRRGDNGINDGVHDAFEVDRQRRAYSYLVRSIENTCELFAFELRHAADDASNIHTDKINRIVLSRCERDLFCITKAYHDEGYDSFTSRLKDQGENNSRDDLYVESIQYLMSKLP